MKSTRKDLGSYNLQVIETKKFRTLTMRIDFHSPIQKNEITKRNILSDILLQSTKEYPTKRDMIIASENLYAADIYNHTQRVGNYIMTSFILQVLDDKYTEKGNFEKAIEFLGKILFDPDVEENSFKEEKLSIVKKNCSVALSSIKEDAGEYAFIRLKEAYGKESPISYRMMGYKEDLEEITGKNLYEYYKKMLDQDFVDIYMVGDISIDKALSILKKQMKFRKVKKKKVPYEVEQKPLRKKKLIAREKIENTQSKLAIACPIKKAKDYEKNYPLVLANIILGGGVDSKLFRDVREKKSLCYSIYSSYSKLDQMFFIASGIDRENYDKTVEEITKIIENMQKGKMTEKEIKVAKEFYQTSLTNIEENPMSLIREYLTQALTGLEPYEERASKMNKVTKQQIVRAIKKVKMDTIYLLEGEKNEDN